jgi:hypothetical protein
MMMHEPANIKRHHDILYYMYQATTFRHVIFHGSEYIKMAVSVVVSTDNSRDTPLKL